MGKISDQLRQQLADMKARHALADAETARETAEAWHYLAEAKAAQAGMEAALRAMWRSRPRHTGVFSCPKIIH